MYCVLVCSYHLKPSVSLVKQFLDCKHNINSNVVHTVSSAVWPHKWPHDCNIVGKIHMMPGHQNPADIMAVLVVFWRCFEDTFKVRSLKQSLSRNHSCVLLLVSWIFTLMHIYCVLLTCYSFDAMQNDAKHFVATIYKHDECIYCKIKVYIVVLRILESR